MEVEDSQQNHDDEHAQLLLLSADGTEFKVNTVILTTASRFFREMLEMPRDPAEAGKPVELAEKRDVIAGLLDIIHADERPMPNLSNFDFVWRLLKAADKYDMPRVPALIRPQVMFKARRGLVEQYALASEYNWAEERRWAAVQLLGMDLQSIMTSKGFRRLSTDHMAKLLSHRAERKRLLAREVELHLTHEHEWEAPHDDPEPEDTIRTDLSASWRLVVGYVLSELDKRPRGDNIGTWLIWDDNKFPAMWDEKCEICGKRFSTPVQLLVKLQRKSAAVDADDKKNTSL
ncbi:hypothetical protein BD410DRAFT_826115 [Rickenella mellea]|uniref:BTB domain-containing protein n=1 Tax=Rickenella mellea TaxID=50990 RepID=A0A4Y7QF41_9AGAM|nr:hypothetical protein BD410DRAFT_826115 [Rickenella mellea]